MSTGAAWVGAVVDSCIAIGTTKTARRIIVIKLLLFCIFLFSFLVHPCFLFFVFITCGELLVSKYFIEILLVMI
jgi:hypothetical protein